MTFDEIVEKWGKLCPLPSGRKTVPSEFERSLFSSEQRGWFTARQSAVQNPNPSLSTLREWIEPKTTDIKSFHSHYSKSTHWPLMVLHLHCAEAVLQHPKSPSLTDKLEAELKHLAEKNKEPIGFVRDLAEELRSKTLRPPKLKQTMVFPLVKYLDDEPISPVNADLILELLDDEEARFYPVPALAFVDRGQWLKGEDKEDTFVQAEEDGQQAVRATLPQGICWKQSVRWHLRLHDGSSLPLQLQGNSAGAAFALGALSLLARGDKGRCWKAMHFIRSAIYGCPRGPW